MKKSKNDKTIINIVLCSILLTIKIILFFSCILNILALFIPLYSMQILDRVLSNRSMDTLLWLTFMILIILFLFYVIQIIRSIIINKISYWFENKLSKSVLLNSMELFSNFNYLSENQHVKDLQNLKLFITSQCIISIIDIPWSIIFIFSLFLIHVYMGLLAIFSILILLILKK